MGKEENKVESYLNDEVEKLGGITRKWVSPGRAGVPDRIVILNGDIWFVEVKQEGEEPEPHQLREMRRLMTAGANATWVSGEDAVDKFIENISTVQIDDKMGRAVKLIRALYAKASKDQHVDQHNPYRWSELNTGLMVRIREFM